MKRSLWFLALLAALVTGPAFAQGAGGSTGSIQGEITDESGAVLPGVTVTATGAAALGAQSAVTNSQGIYRFTGLPAGTYKLVFEMTGFGKVSREDVRIGIGFTATVNAKMSVKTMAEEVTVTGESTTIDTSSNRVQTNFDKGMLDALPNARDMWSLLAETPAITLNRFDVGGSTAGTQTTYVAYGNGGQNRPLIEGINTTEGTSASGFYFDYGSFDEVVIGAAGNSVEMPSGGVITNFIGKQGGNQFKGELYYEYENDKIQSSNVTDEQLGRGYANLPRNVIQSLGLDRHDANTLVSYKNLNASIGGPVIKDKLWWHFNYLRQQNVVYQPAGGAILDGTGFLTKLTNYTGKTTYQMTPKDKIIGYFQWGAKAQPFRTDSVVTQPQHATAASTLNQSSPSWVGKLEYNRTFGNRGFFEIRAGEFGYNFGLDGNSEDPRREDSATRAVTGGGRHWLLKRRRDQLFSSYTFFIDNKLGGNHQMKVGGEYQRETGETIWKSYYANNVVQIFNNRVANQVRLGNPTDSLSGLKNLGLYANDVFSLKKLTLNVGVRYDRYTPYLPEQSRPAGPFSTAATFAAIDNVITFNHIVPRVGAIFDVQGNGKTVIKLNYGKYYFNPGVTLADTVSNNPGDQFSTYNWTDLNGDGLWQRGEEGATPIAQTGGASSVTFDPDLRNSYTNELSVWLERELPGKVGARIGYVYKMDRDGYQRENVNRPLSAWNVPTTVADLGPDGLTGTGDDRTVPALGISAATLALPIVNRVFNVAGYEANYKSIEAGITKRFTKKWNLVSSVIFTNTNEFGTSYFGSGAGNNVGASGSLFGGLAGSTAAPVSPNGKADQSDFWTYNFKIHGSYAPGWNMKITPIFRIQQGYPFARVFTATVTGVTAHNFLVGNLGDDRLQTVKQLDLRIDKGIKLGGRANLSVILDAFNVFNANPELNKVGTTGRTVINEPDPPVSIPSFNSITTILPPRIFRLSGRFTF